MREVGLEPTRLTATVFKTVLTTYSNILASVLDVLVSLMDKKVEPAPLSTGIEAVRVAFTVKLQDCLLQVPLSVHMFHSRYL